MEEKKTPDKGKLLLKSYAMSLLSLMLCVTMLVGTTYAWFTSDVTTGSNEIQVGTLKVDMVNKKTGESLKGAEGLFGGPQVKWEPGATWFETIQVKNYGDLAFDYSLYFNTVIENPDQIDTVGKYIDVYVAPAAVSEFDLNDILNGWIRVGTLADVVKHNMQLANGSWTKPAPEGGEVINEITIALHMPATFTGYDSNGNSLMGLRLKGFGLRLNATQKLHETDGFGSGYDHMASTALLAATYEELESAFLSGMDVRLTADITAPANKTLTVPTGANMVLDLNGFTLTGSSLVDAENAAVNRELILVKGNLTVKGIKDAAATAATEPVDPYKGGIVYSHTGTDMAWNCMSNAFTVTAGGTLTLNDVKVEHQGGTKMNYAVHTGNAANVALYTNNSHLKAQYIAVRVFNNAAGISNVIARDSILEGKYSLWVQFYFKEDYSNAGNDFDQQIIKDRLNISLYEGNNTLIGSQLRGYERYEFRVHDKASFDQAFAQEASVIVLEADIDLGDSQYTLPGDLTLDLNGHKLTGAYTGADHYAMFTVPNGASMTVEGEGKVTASTEVTADNRSLAIFQNAGNLTINGGTYSIGNVKNDHTWIIATIVDNRTKSATDNAVLTINGGDFSVTVDATNLFRNYPQQGGKATLIINDGKFHANGDKTTYIWNQESGSYPGELYFNGGTYDAGVVYEDYNGQSDVHIATGVVINAYSGNN